MSSTIFLIATIVLIAIGAFLGFQRGILKEGIRVALWIVLFVIASFFISNILETMVFVVDEKLDVQVTDIEQLVKYFLEKSEILREDTYLVRPLTELLSSLFIPIIAIVLYWICGFVSFLLYLIICAICFRKKEKEKSMVFSITGLLLGIIFALFSGMLTLYPIKQVSGAIQQGDTSFVIREEMEIAVDLAECYEGEPVQILYRFTGMEWLAENVHSALIGKVISTEEHNIWKQLPTLVQVGSWGYEVYDNVSDKELSQLRLEPYVKKTVELYFSLEFITEQNKLDLLNHLKAVAQDEMDDEIAEMILDWIVIQNKEQVIGDAIVFGELFDLLNKNGLNVSVWTQDKVMEVLDKVYQLSNANVIVPEFINFVYEMLLGEEVDELTQTENLVLTEETKADVSELVNIMFELSDLLNKIDTLSLEQKLEALQEMEQLKENPLIGEENYLELLEYMRDRI